jgi:hypothetical protein
MTAVATKLISPEEFMGQAKPKQTVSFEEFAGLEKPQEPAAPEAISFAEFAGVNKPPVSVEEFAGTQTSQQPLTPGLAELSDVRPEAMRVNIEQVLRETKPDIEPWEPGWYEATLGALGHGTVRTAESVYGTGERLRRLAWDTQQSFLDKLAPIIPATIADLRGVSRAIEKSSRIASRSGTQTNRKRGTALNRSQNPGKQFGRHGSIHDGHNGRLYVGRLAYGGRRCVCSRKPRRIRECQKSGRVRKSGASGCGNYGCRQCAD